MNKTKAAVAGFLSLVYIAIAGTIFYLVPTIDMFAVQTEVSTLTISLVITSIIAVAMLAGMLPVDIKKLQSLKDSEMIPLHVALSLVAMVVMLAANTISFGTVSELSATWQAIVLFTIGQPLVSAAITIPIVIGLTMYARNSDLSQVREPAWHMFAVVGSVMVAATILFARADIWNIVLLAAVGTALVFSNRKKRADLQSVQKAA